MEISKHKSNTTAMIISQFADDYDNDKNDSRHNHYGCLKYISSSHEDKGFFG